MDERLESLRLGLIENAKSMKKFAESQYKKGIEKFFWIECIYKCDREIMELSNMKPFSKLKFENDEGEESSLELKLS